MNKAKQVHINYCDYMVKKASDAKVYTVKAHKTIGVKRYNMTRNDLIMALAKAM